MDEVLFAVEWEGGKITGFQSENEAERYIEYICKKVSGRLNYSIYKYYSFPRTKSR